MTKIASYNCKRQLLAHLVLDSHPFHRCFKKKISSNVNYLYLSMTRLVLSKAMQTREVLVRISFANWIFKMMHSALKLLWSMATVTTMSQLSKLWRYSMITMRRPLLSLSVELLHLQLYLWIKRIRIRRKLSLNSKLTRLWILDGRMTQATIVL